MSKKKLLLMYPNLRWQKDDMGTTWNLNPATLCLLAAMVRDFVDVKIVDAQFQNLSRDNFRHEVEKYKPDYVGISILTSEYRDTLDVASEIVKSVDKNIKVIAGGVHVTTMYSYVMQNKNIDFGVIGEGEHVLQGLIKFLNGDGEFPQEGLAYRKGDAIEVQNRAIVHDLKSLPWPAYDLIDFKAYTETNPRAFNPQRPPESPYVRMVTTRGCPFGCVFCQVDLISGKSVRSRDPYDVVKEIEFLKEKYGIKSIIFDDDNMLMAGDDYCKKLFTFMIERRINIRWIGIAFALFLLTDELLDLMKESGCVGINVAIESGNKRVLKQIVKKPIHNLAKIPDLINKIKKRGLYCIANFVIGFPGETWDEIRETINFAEKCGADYIKIFVAVPLYNTKLYQMAMNMGVLECDNEFPEIDWRYGKIRSKEWTSKDISILRAYEWDRINFKNSERIDKLVEMTGLTRDELKVIRKRTRDNLIL